MKSNSLAVIDGRLAAVSSVTDLKSRVNFFRISDIQMNLSKRLTISFDETCG